MAALEVEVEGLEDERGRVTGINGDGAVSLVDGRTGDLAGGLGGRREHRLRRALSFDEAGTPCLGRSWWRCCSGSSPAGSWL